MIFFFKSFAHPLYWELVRVLDINVLWRFGGERLNGKMAEERNVLFIRSIMAEQETLPVFHWAKSK